MLSRTMAALARDLEEDTLLAQILRQSRRQISRRYRQLKLKMFSYYFRSGKHFKNLSRASGGAYWAEGMAFNCSHVGPCSAGISAAGGAGGAFGGVGKGDVARFGKHSKNLCLTFSGAKSTLGISFNVSQGAFPVSRVVV